MALYNQNFEAKLLTVTGSPYDINEMGDNVSASTIHQIFCLSPGEITITALGGGVFTWSAATSEYVDVLATSCNVISGEFVGFRSQHVKVQQLPYYKY